MARSSVLGLYALVARFRPSDKNVSLKRLFVAIQGLFRRALVPAMIVISLGLASCTSGDWGYVRRQNASMVLSMYRARPLAAATGGQTNLSVHDCIKLGLENSLDMQTAMWEEHVRRNAAKGSLVRMFPKLEGTYFLDTRDRPLFSRSDVLDQEGAFEVVGPGPGTGVTQFSTGRERFTRTWQAILSWSPMDALMARYLSMVRVNEATHSSYQRVRVAQQLIGTISASFYRLMALMEGLPKARALETHRKNISRDLDSLRAAELVDSQEYLTAKSLLAEATNQAAEVALNIGKQRELLAIAMNVSPDSPFCPVGQLTQVPPTSLEPCKLEEASLMNRPEAYQADLTFESSTADHKRTIVKLFPRVEGFIGYWRDENKFLLNKNWTDGGMKITWDFMEFTAGLLERGAARDRAYKTDQERAVISMGILSQVRLRTLEAMRALERYKKTSDLTTQAKEALRIAREVEEVKDKRSPEKVMRIAREKALCNVLQAELDQFMALGEVHAAIAELDSAVGSNYPVSQANARPVRADCQVPANSQPGFWSRAVGCFGGILPR